MPFPPSRNCASARHSRNCCSIPPHRVWRNSVRTRRGGLMSSSTNATLRRALTEAAVLTLDAGTRVSRDGRATHAYFRAAMAAGPSSPG